jgi:hypothetical protein
VEALFRRFNSVVHDAREGFSASEPIRGGLRVVASRYYRNRRPPTTGLFVAMSMKLGDEGLSSSGIGTCTGSP